MSNVAKPKDRIDVSGNSGSLKQSLAGLAALRDRLPAGAAPSTVPTGATPRANPEGPIARAKKLVLRRERKGHGGKTATRIEGLSANADELDATLRELKRALGCGAAIDSGDIVVQGDQTDRLVAYLESHGAKKVIVGS